MQNYKTEELVRQAKRQDADAFTELMQLHMKDMYRVAYAILMNDEDVADAVQETICKFRINGAPFPRQRCKRLAPAVRYPFVTC